MATPGTDEDHDMDEQSDVEDDNRVDNHNENDHANGQQDVADESSTPTDYSLYSIHPRLQVLRQQLHDLDHPIELPKADFEAIMPYMDNVWRKLKSSEQSEASQNIDLYWCKLRKHPGAKPHVPRPTPEGKQARKRKMKEEKACTMAMKVVHSFGPVDKVTIRKAVEGERHAHDLDFMDLQKRNSGIMDTARKEATRGFQPASIWWKMQQEPEKLEAAGGKFMKISDVRNVQYPWRQENPDVILKAHTGYNSARTGPKPGQSQKAKSSPAQAPTQPIPQTLEHPQSSHGQPPQTQHLLHPAQPPPPPPPPPPPADVLHFPPELRGFLTPYLPNPNASSDIIRPHVTLTWASSLDGRIASSPGYRTTLSGPDTKAMTHYLRSAHDAILVGVRTAIADDPSLNCRLSGAGGFGGPRGRWQPRPIIIDPTGRLIIRPEMKMLQVAVLGRAKPPWIVVGPNANLHPVAVQTLKAHGGEYLMINEVDHHGRFRWDGIFRVMLKENIRSVMIEGGGLVLSELLSQRYAQSIDSVIMTMTPTFLGSRGVQVTPETEFDNKQAILQNRLKYITWQPLGPSGDAVMCGRIEHPSGQSNGILQGILEIANADGSNEQHQQPQPPPPPPNPQHHSPGQHRSPYPPQTHPQGPLPQQPQAPPNHPPQSHLPQPYPPQQHAYHPPQPSQPHPHPPRPQTPSHIPSRR
ncbi:uncharacterized protein HMPREF1541_01144 [Cyphellophora europaea CBS 101466]|uniref:2,5-diamino-6-ribosylamino-4(3H)-pyrimidinone 5'-phosphate reductase n=1 Tax=Cyphellophora europaea (strain CBS 101466) TaxID=1220924 RepID=W2SGF9_CYPE1|nr:uncharacterized protein HMPREF1541_01144 [Cyphellophora europaea CBS 101466]ETN46954.1 hypothetical protein HMPREF1541_01144 [Cyphellophora europaea CBS 101466]